jgi:hypothetical protein
MVEVKIRVTSLVIGLSKMYCAKRSITVSTHLTDKQINLYKTEIGKTRFVYGSVRETIQVPGPEGMLSVPSSGELTILAYDYSGNKKTCRVKYTLTSKLFHLFLSGAVGVNLG